MIRRNISPILHRFPLAPRFNSMDTSFPNTLSPNNILQIQCSTVIHNPLCDFLAGIRSLLYIKKDISPQSSTKRGVKMRRRTYTPIIRTHHIRRLPTTMITPTPTPAIPRTINRLHPPWPPLNNLLRPINSNLFTSSYCRDRRGSITTPTISRRLTAFELRGTGTLVCD